MSELENAKKLYKTWHNYENADIVNIDIPVPTGDLVDKGEIIRLDYTSPKWEHEEVYYYHHFRKNNPVLMEDKKGNLFINGNIKVTELGIDDWDEPQMFLPKPRKPTNTVTKLGILELVMYVDPKSKKPITLTFGDRYYVADPSADWTFISSPMDIPVQNPTLRQELHNVLRTHGLPLDALTPDSPHYDKAIKVLKESGIYKRFKEVGTSKNPYPIIPIISEQGAGVVAKLAGGVMGLLMAKELVSEIDKHYPRTNNPASSMIGKHFVYSLYGDPLHGSEVEIVEVMPPFPGAKRSVSFKALFPDGKIRQVHISGLRSIGPGLVEKEHIRHKLNPARRGWAQRKRNRVMHCSRPIDEPILEYLPMRHHFFMIDDEPYGYQVGKQGSYIGRDRPLRARARDKRNWKCKPVNVDKHKLMGYIREGEQFGFQTDSGPEAIIKGSCLKWAERVKGLSLERANPVQVSPPWAMDQWVTPNEQSAIKAVETAKEFGAEQADYEKTDRGNYMIHLKWRIEEGTNSNPKGNVYQWIYNKLVQVVPKELIDNKVPSGVSHSGGFMDLHYDYLREDEKGHPLIALAHYYQQEGDQIPDPDMEIRIYPEHKMAEAMTYQDTFGYRQVYHPGNMVDVRAKKELNQFLNIWLRNLIMQGHKIIGSKENPKYQVPAGMTREQFIAEGNEKVTELNRKAENEYYQNYNQYMPKEYLPYKAKMYSRTASDMLNTLYGIPKAQVMRLLQGHREMSERRGMRVGYSGPSVFGGGTTVVPKYLFERDYVLGLAYDYLLGTTNPQHNTKKIKTYRIPRKGDRIRFWELLPDNTRIQKIGTVLYTKKGYIHLTIDGQEGKYFRRIHPAEIIGHANTLGTTDTYVDVDELTGKIIDIAESRDSANRRTIGNRILELLDELESDPRYDSEAITELEEEMINLITEHDTSKRHTLGSRVLDMVEKMFRPGSQNPNKSKKVSKIEIVYKGKIEDGEYPHFADIIYTDGTKDKVDLIIHEKYKQLSGKISGPTGHPYSTFVGRHLDFTPAGISKSLIEYAEGQKVNNPDLIPGGLAEGMTIEQIAMKHKVPLSQIAQEYNRGVEVEMEHTTNRRIAEEIARDHLFEYPDYYTRLARIETNPTIKDPVTYWTEEANKYLKGRKIVGIRYMTEEEKKEHYWTNKPIVIHLDDGSLFYPVSDDEGNDAGVIFGQTRTEDFAFPRIYSRGNPTKFKVLAFGQEHTFDTWENREQFIDTNIRPHGYVYGADWFTAEE